MALQRILLATLAVAFIVVVQSDDICENGSKMFEWKADPESCSTFYLCFNGKALKYKCPKESVVDPVSKSCVAKGSSADKCSKKKIDKDLKELIDDNCGDSDDMYFAHPKNCAKYYECGGDDSDEEEFSVRECPYPLLFNKEYKRCEFHVTANCGKRYQPKDPCEYSANQCVKSSHCVPCNVRFPSCANLEDGLQPWIGREWSPFFVVCKEGRVVYQGQCAQDGYTNLFHPQKRLCYSGPSLVDNNTSN